MKKRMFVYFFIFTISVFHLSIPNVVFGQSQSFAEQVFTDYAELLQQENVRFSLLNALDFFKRDDIQETLLPIDMQIYLKSPLLLSGFEEFDEEFINLLSTDDDFQAFFGSELFYNVIISNEEINKLVELIEKTPAKLEIVSGDYQLGDTRKPLELSFVVVVKDRNDNPLSNIVVAFRVTKGTGGRPLPTTARTNSMGRAATTLTLGSESGIYQVEAKVVNFPSLTQTFTAAATDTIVGEVPEPNPKPTTLFIVSGSAQTGDPGTPLSEPFIVAVQDQYGNPLSGVTVKFSVTEETGGRLSHPLTPRTNADGIAATTLTLGPKPGANLVVATVEGITPNQTFMAIAIGSDDPEPAEPTATALSIVEGNAQQGHLGDQLDDQLVVKVYDQNGDPLKGVSVNFSVRNGSLTKTQVKTDQSGLAQTKLTLGQEAGITEVTASVNGIPWDVTFTATAIEPSRATTLAMVSGFSQENEAGEPLSEPFVVEVRDQYGNPLSGVTVVFSVTEGDGSLSHSTTPRTNSEGRAATTLTLGPKPGANWVEVIVADISSPLIFAATATFDEKDLDVNKDGFVNILDLTMVISLIILQDTQNVTDVEIFADVNNDGTVDITDMILVASELHSIAAAPSIHVLLQGGISTADVQKLLTQAKALPEAIQAYPIYQRGIVVLEQLLATLTEVPAVPEQTALLLNYPNPFNPETWIPYELSEATDVEVSIYTVDGRLVRTLTLGHQPAGLYQRKSRAAYWDGRNEFGERVASGLYFYTLTAGNFTATRKMLIRK